MFWPRKLLAPRKATPEPVYATVGAGRTLTAVEQIIASDAGYWEITLDEIPIASRDQKRTARAISAQLNGRLNTISVPIYDDGGAPWPVVGGSELRSNGAIHFSDGAAFSDGSSFSQPVIVAYATGQAQLGAVQIAISVFRGAQLWPGMHFSVTGATNDRLYRIINIVSRNSGAYIVQVWPPVREIIPGASQLNFDDPHLTCRLKTDAEMASFADDYAGRTLAKVAFVEALP